MHDANARVEPSLQAHWGKLTVQLYYRDTTLGMSNTKTWKQFFFLNAYSKGFLVHYIRDTSELFDLMFSKDFRVCNSSLASLNLYLSLLISKSPNL